MAEQDTTDSKRQALANNNYGAAQSCPGHADTYKEYLQKHPELAPTR